MSRAALSLRERQAQHVRDAVLEAVTTALETKGPDDLSMAEIAEAAGLSLRTLYRHFSDRDSLLAAAGERLYASLGVPIAIGSAEDIAPSFRQAARRLAARPKLVRALVQTRAGRAARAGVRDSRVEAIRTALQPVAGQLDPDFARRAGALIAHLCSAASWVAIADENGLPDLEAQAAVGWAIETLVRSLQEEAGRSASLPRDPSRIEQEEPS